MVVPGAYGDSARSFLAPPLAAKSTPATFFLNNILITITANFLVFNYYKINNSQFSCFYYDIK